MHSSRAHAAPRSALGLAARLYVLLAAVAVTALTFGAYSTPYFPVDLQLERAIQTIRTPWIDALTAVSTWLGFFPQVDVMVLLMVFGLCLVRLRLEGVMTLFAAGGAALVFWVVAPLVHRARPSTDLVRVTDVIGVGGFPSGHVLTMTAFYGFLIYLAFTFVRPIWLRTLITAFGLLVILGMGFGRIYVGEHWPSDVLGGYLFGTLWLAVIIAVYSRWRRRQSRLA